LQWAGSPVSSSRVQGSPSSGQAVGQVVGGSQVSPAPIRASPQRGPQSESVATLHPAGQQPSSSRQAVIVSCRQTRVQPATDPAARSTVQASASSQDRAQAPGMPDVIPRSHSSPGSTTPSPHTTGQSESSSAVQPAGQQPSPPTQAVIGVAAQLAEQVAAEPRGVTLVQDPAAGQLVGQEPSPAASSQASTGGSTTPLPQIGAQSGSVVKLAPGGQQPSPARAAVTPGCAQVAEQVPADSSRSSVQGSPSAQPDGQAPTIPAGIAMSQASPGCTTPSPQLAEQSGSLAAVHPDGQQPSLWDEQVAT
jgi:hypothetical protein